MKSVLIFVVVAVSSVSATPLLGQLGGLTSSLRVTRSANPDPCWFCMQPSGGPTSDLTSSHRVTRSANPLLGGILGGGGNDGAKGGVLGINAGGLLDGIIGTSGEAQSASKTSVFFKELHELIYNILNSDNTPAMINRNKYLARALVDKVRGGGFCDIQSGKGVSVEYAELARNYKY